MRFDGRDLLDRTVRFWRSSLRVRVVAITVILSAVAVTAIGAYIAVSVRGNLFDQRREQIVEEAGRAATRAEGVFTQAASAGGDSDLDAVQQDAVRAIVASVSNSTILAFQRAPGQDGAPAMEDRRGPGWQNSMASAELRSAVRKGGANHVAWQSI